MVKLAALGQPEEKVPVLEEGQLAVHLADLLQQAAVDGDGVEGDVVVDQQQLGVEVAAVGQPPLDTAPTVL